MQVKTYIRVAEGGRGPRVVASSKPNYEPLMKGQGTYHETPLPTAMFAVVFDIPNEIFTRAEQVLAKVAIAPGEATVAAEIEPQ